MPNLFWEASRNFEDTPQFSADALPANRLPIPMVMNNKGTSWSVERKIIPMAQEFTLSDLSNSSRLSFPLTLADGSVIESVGDAAAWFASLTLEQRDKSYWMIAIRMLNNALKEPTYLKTATMSLQTALVLEGLLNSSQPLDSH